MNTTAEIIAKPVISEPVVGLLKRISVFTYGLLAYAAGCGSLFWLILAVGGIAPVGLSIHQVDTPQMALLVNLGLVLVFGVQHSVMARARFKNWLTRYIPQAAERATYMLMTGLVTSTLLYYWQPVTGTVWTIDNTLAQMMLWGFYAIGWSYLLLSTFVTNHFELMGLRQVYLYLINVPYTKLPFTRKYMYSYSRHPMMLGMLAGIWCVPVMSVTHFALAILLSIYIAVGILLEERDHLHNFGETYRHYRKQIATFIPKIF